MEITGINERPNSDTLNQDERNEEKKKLLARESILEKKEHLAKGTSVRLRQE